MLTASGQAVIVAVSGVTIRAMNRLEFLESEVRQRYLARDPGRADWADWLYGEHLFVVAENAGQLAVQYGANVGYSKAAAMLHDIADSDMKRSDPAHEQHSLDVARALLQGSGYASQEIALIVDDAIRWHGCHDGHVPSSQEGEVLATADALAHLMTNFYELAIAKIQVENGDRNAQAWARAKLERDFHSKIQFDAARAEARTNYERIKATIAIR